MSKAIFYIAPEYVKYEGWYLKAYQSGTTISLDIFLDEAETTSVDKLIVNANGFFEHEGNIITPRVGGRYDLYLIPTEDEADNNIISNAIILAKGVVSEVILGEGGSIELATEDKTGIVKFEGTDDSQGSIVLNITNARNAIKAVFETLKYTEQDITDLSNSVWITPSRARQMIVDSTNLITENWDVGEIIYKEDSIANASEGFLKMDGQPFDGNTYPRLALLNAFKSKNILSLDLVNSNVDVTSRPENSKPVIVKCDDIYFMVVATGTDIYIFKSTDGLNYTFQAVQSNYLTNNSFDNFHAAYDGDNKIILLSNSNYGFYNISGNSFDAISNQSDLANPNFVHFNTRLNKYVVFSRNIDYTFGTISKDGIYTQESLYDTSFSGTGLDTNGVLSTGNYGAGDIHYSVEGNYHVIFNKVSDIVLYKVNEFGLSDAFNEANNIKNLTVSSGSPLLNGSTTGIDNVSLKRRGCAVNNDNNFATIDYATDLETSIYVKEDGVTSYKVITNPFPINNTSGIIPLGGKQYLLVGDLGDGIAYTDDAFSTISLSNSTNNTSAIGRVGTGSGIFVNELNKYIVVMRVGTDNTVRYIDIDATKVSEYATIDLTSRSLGNTSLHVFAGLPE